MMNLLRAIGKRARDIDLVIPGYLEKALLGSKDSSIEEKIDLPLIAIVGPPRVGSTLMYQILAARYEVFCYDNFQHTFLRYPYLSFLVSHYCLPRAQFAYTSDHGFVTGLTGLSEGNFFWPFWFDMQMNQKLPEPAPDRLHHVCRVLNRIHAINGSPMVSSYNAHAFYLVELERLFGKLVVVNLRRDPVTNALSLLRARRLLRSDLDQWWSIRPARCAAGSSKDPHAQIACQIVETYRAIQQQRALLSHVSFVDVDYDELCANSNSVLSQIERVCQDVAVDLKPRSRSGALPETSARGARPDEEEDAERFRFLFHSTNWDELFRHHISCRVC